MGPAFHPAWPGTAEPLASYRPACIVPWTRRCLVDIQRQATTPSEPSAVGALYVFCALAVVGWSGLYDV